MTFVPVGGLLGLFEWNGWRDATFQHGWRGLFSLLLMIFPGTVALFYASGYFSGFGLTPYYSASIALALGAILGVVWGPAAMKPVLSRLDHGQQATRSWRDPNPGFGLLMAGGFFLLLGWLVATYVDRNLIPTAAFIPPSTALCLGGIGGAFDLTIAAILLRRRRTSGRVVEVSVKGDGWLYQDAPLARKAKASVQDSS